MKDLVPQIVNAIRPLLNKPYFIYGHSMGGAVGYEVIHELHSLGARVPDHFFVGACISPKFKTGPSSDTKLHRNKTAEEMKDLLKSYGGTPEAVLNNNELMDLLLPMIKADFTIAQEYVHDHPNPMIPVPITYFKASEDHLVASIKQAWDEHTENYSEIVVDSGHFFITTHSDRFLALFLARLEEVIS